MHYHIVGIAGAGMSAMAHLLLDQGHQVSGSDLAQNAQTAALTARGATIYQGHDPAYVRGATQVLATAAVRPEHVELAAARAAGVPVIGRATLWQAWSQQRPVLAVAGTHGKTTTSAMLALALRGAGVQAGYLIGAHVPDLGGSAAWGDPHAPLVIEADEYDRVFLALHPQVAIITNLEWDHPDIYPTPEAYQAAFAQFASQVADPRRVLVCADDAGTQSLGLADATLYGIEERLASDPVSCRLAPLDWSASGVQPNGSRGVSFDLWHYNRRRMAQQRVANLDLRVAGSHNVRNALAVLAACATLGLDLAAAARALSQFSGTARRFEIKGEAHGVLVIDDYAHHPTEVQATLAAARATYPERRLVAYLQPHTFSRTTALLEAWPEACRAADLLLVGAIYAAREQGDAEGLAQQLTAQFVAAGVAARYAGTLAATVAALRATVQPGDLVLTLGAGDGYQVGERLLEHLHA
ncbi:MAG: UDP-N-acetylmuramate--L-alanine ligase [Oscillochloridaceae bacterium umkhey_bin13]